MKYKNSAAIIRTRTGNTVGCIMIATYNYQTSSNGYFPNPDYICNEFGIMENVGGQIIVATLDKFTHANVECTNTITINDVTSIEILSKH